MLIKLRTYKYILTNFATISFSVTLFHAIQSLKGYFTFDTVSQAALQSINPWATEDCSFTPTFHFFIV
jgi:hypothetical protein